MTACRIQGIAGRLQNQGLVSQSFVLSRIRLTKRQVDCSNWARRHSEWLRMHQSLAAGLFRCATEFFSSWANFSGGSQQVTISSWRQSKTSNSSKSCSTSEFRRYSKVIQSVLTIGSGFRLCSSSTIPSIFWGQHTGFNAYLEYSPVAQVVVQSVNNRLAWQLI